MRAYRALINKFRARLGRVFKHFALAGGVQQIGIDRKGSFAALVFRHRDLILLGVSDELFAALQIPFAPWRDNFNVRITSIITKLKAHLIIPLTSGAMAHGISTCLRRNFDLPFGNQRPRYGCAQQINTLIQRVGAEHGEDIIADEFLTQVLNINFLNAQHFGLLPCWFELFALPQIGSKGHHFALIDILQPF